MNATAEALKLSKADIEELVALAETNDAIKGPSFVMRFHWHVSGYSRLVRRGLITWGDPPAGFDRRKFAGTHITDAGRAAIAKATASPSTDGENK